MQDELRRPVREMHTPGRVALAVSELAGKMCTEIISFMLISIFPIWFNSWHFAANTTALAAGIQAYPGEMQAGRGVVVEAGGVFCAWRQM